MLVAALVAAVVAMVASAAVAVGADARWGRRRSRISLRLPACGTEASWDCRERFAGKHGWIDDG